MLWRIGKWGNHRASRTVPMCSATFFSGQIWTVVTRAPAPIDLELPELQLSISTFGRTSDGQLLVADFAMGAIHQTRPQL